MDRRRQEIAEKKSQLEELKRARQERLIALKSRGAGGTETPGREAAQTPLRTSRQDVDDLVTSLLGPPSTSASGVSTPTIAPPSATPLRRPSSIANNQNVGTSTSTGLEFARPKTPAFRRKPSEGLAVGLSAGSGSRPATPAVGGGRPGSRLSHVAGEVESPMSHGEKENGLPAESEVSPPDLVDQHEELYEVATKPVYITYSRGIQTNDTSSSSSSGSASPPVSDTESISGDHSRSTRRDRRRSRKEPSAVGGETMEQLRTRMEAEFEIEKEKLEREIRAEEALKREAEARSLELQPEDRQAIVAAPDFSRFMEESTKIVQRALNDTYDFTRDYSIGVEGDAEPSDASSVKLVCAFGGRDKWTEHRSITAVDWSPKFPELVASAYNQNPAAPADPHGTVAVWNLHLVECPEFIFHSQSDVLSLAFSPYHPNLLFGGTYSGQINLWDTRAKSSPVLKTPLSASGHTYPIYAMQVVGTQNANQLVTASTDGTICAWTSDMLARPQEVLELTSSGHARTNEVSITCMAFPENESSTFWLGTEEGGVYQANRYARAGSKAGLNQKEIYRGHSGPVTSLHFHPLRGPVDFSDLFLTTGVDWTVKLWRARAANKPSAQSASSAQGPVSLPALRSFEESGDYVYDAKWHTAHPAMFATADGSGKFDLWNLNVDIEMPISSVPVGSTGKPLNKLAWDRHQGRKIALGSGDGSLYVYDVGEQALPKETEWSEMQRTVQGMLASGKDTGHLS